MLHDRQKKRIRLTILAVLAALQGSALSAEGEPARSRLALMGTIPIYWGEAETFDDHINGEAHQHWARAELERGFDLQPLDFLSAENLDGQQFLLMAQPRGLAAQENVALDNWVRVGGRLLLFADPVMTGHSQFPFGDRRRPQDIALLSPILSHWGLELHFDEGQQPGPRVVEHFAVPLPVNQAGRLVAVDGRFECTVSAAGIIAHCALGTGEVLILADAALLDMDGPYPGAAGALHMLTSHIFGEFGENAGSAAADNEHAAQTLGNRPNSAWQANGQHVDRSP